MKMNTKKSIEANIRRPVNDQTSCKRVDREPRREDEHIYSVK
jgi:hypothetical protein